MCTFYMLFSVLPIGDSSVGFDVVAMVCMSILPVVSTPFGMTECHSEVCKSGVENEQFDCPAYAHIQYSHATLFHGIPTISSFLQQQQ